MKYLFYRFYRGALFIRKGGDPEQRAWMVFSIAQGINIYSLEQFYFSLTHQKENLIPDYIYIFIALAICVVNYFLYLHKDRFKRISEKYNTESKSARIWGTIIGFLYVIVSIFCVFYAKHLQFS